MNLQNGEVTYSNSAVDGGYTVDTVAYFSYTSHSEHLKLNFEIKNGKHIYIYIYIYTLQV